MRSFILPALIGLLTLPALSSAQPYYGPPGPYGPPGRMSREEAMDIARYWYRSYLRRSARPDEARYWADQLLRSQTPANALSGFLGGREYWDYAGGTRDRFIAQLIGDVGHHRARGYEVADYMRRTQGMDPKDIAYMFLQEYPANWWPGPEATPPDELRRGEPDYEAPPPDYYRRGYYDRP